MAVIKRLYQQVFIGHNGLEEGDEDPMHSRPTLHLYSGLIGLQVIPTHLMYPYQFYQRFECTIQADVAVCGFVDTYSL